MSFCSSLGPLAGPCKAIGDVKDAVFTPGVEKKIGNIKDILASVGSCIWDKVDLVTLGTCLSTDIPAMSPILTQPYLSSLAAACMVDEKTMNYINQQLAQMFGKTWTPPAKPKPGTGRAPGGTPADQAEAIRKATAWAIVRQLLGKPCERDEEISPGVWSRCRPGFDGNAYSIDFPAVDISPADYQKIQGIAYETAIKAQTGTEMLAITRVIIEAELKKLGKSLDMPKASTKSKLQQQSYLVKAGMGIAAGVAALVLAIYIGKQLKKA